ncbi:MAG: hypothetical protein IT207_10100 [Fimbriimonadaceae bacterium]|nr:hypothetical protein [Fimbriimonadaceae bacterium]
MPALISLACAFFATAAQQESPTWLAIVHTQAHPAPAGPKTWTATALEEWGAKHSFGVESYGGLWVAFPSDLCGVQAEADRTAELLQWVRAAGQNGAMQGSVLAGNLRKDVEGHVAWSASSSNEPPAVDAMEFGLGVNGWFQLESGGKAVWVPAILSRAGKELKAGACSPLEKGKERTLPDHPALSFDAFPSVTVEIASAPGLSPSVRDRSEAAARAMESFRSAVVRASDSVRSAYTSLLAAADDPGSGQVKEGLFADASRATDLPPAVANRLREEMLHGFERFGFASAEEAGRFFDRAEIGDRKARLTLQYQLEIKGREIGVSTEFSGPFTPKG